MARPKTPSSLKKPAPKSKGYELLLEIGTEELPYQFVPTAMTGLRDTAERLFKDQRLTHGPVRAFGTPRRLVLVVEALASRQTAAVKEVMGPSRAVAFDAAGAPTKAALGFAASQGIPIEALEVRSTPKGDYVFAVKRDPGRAATEILQELLPALIASLSFPKSMRWNEAGLRFARPIRWIVAIYGGRIVPFTIGGVTSGNRTRGHRFLSTSPKIARDGLPVKDLNSYMTVLDRHGVVPDPDRRRTLIVDQLSALSASAHGSLHHDEDLVEQAVYTVEYPQVLLGRFDPKYLEVPKDVLMTAMKEHQGFFSLTDERGALLPAFLSVTNMKLADMRLIREGNERVLAARLADAKFFFDEDRKIPLADRVPKLAHVTFHHKLGTLHHKQERLVKLACLLVARLVPHNDALEQICLTAARLCKADLLTGMVGEFPSLQGIMGGEYARHDGEPEAVSRAIRDHHLPHSMDGELPHSVEGQILSLTDRLDTVAAFFHVGLLPTGSEDPFALRRHAAAIVRIILEAALKLDLGQAVDDAVNLVAGDGFKPAASQIDTRHAILQFLLERLRYYGRTAYQLRPDVMEAVLKPLTDGPCDLVDLVLRMQALQALTARPEFDPLMVGFRRAHRIVEKEKWSRETVEPSLFQHQAEAILHKAHAEAREGVPAAVRRGEYAAALNGLVELKPAIDGFFDGVLVNADDERLRANRLSLLCAVDRLFGSVADFSQIVTQGS